LSSASLGGVVARPPGRLLAGRNQKHPLAGHGLVPASRVAGLARLEHRLDPQPVEFIEHRRPRADRLELHPVQLDQHLAVDVGEHHVGNQPCFPRLCGTAGDAHQNFVGERGELPHMPDRDRHNGPAGGRIVGVGEKCNALQGGVQHGWVSLVIGPGDAGVSGIDTSQHPAVVQLSVHDPPERRPVTQAALGQPRVKLVGSEADAAG
jgi:hypothetical protein